MANFLETEAAGLCDLELEGVRDAEDGDPVLLGESMPMGLRVPEGVLKPLERELWRPAAVSLSVCGER